MDLAVLRKKLQDIRKRTETEHSQTFDLTDAKKWMKGNEPEDWLKLVDHVKMNVTFLSTYQKYNVLTDLFEQAFKELDPKTHRNSEAYAHLFVKCARLKSKHLSEDAAYLYNQARTICCKKFAIVHIAAAQFEIDRDDIERAKKILQKALVFEAQPIDDVRQALESLNMGKRSIYVSPTKLSDLTVHHGSESTEEFSAQLTDNLTNNMSLRLEQKTEPNLTSSLVNRQSMRKHHSTPELSSAKKKQITYGLPQRVKKINLPFQAMMETEEDDVLDNTQDTFKPINDSCIDNHTVNSMASFNNHGHTSGYLSATCDSIIHPEKDTSDLTHEKNSKTDLKKETSMPKPNIIHQKNEPRLPEMPKPLCPDFSEKQTTEPVLCHPSRIPMSDVKVCPATSIKHKPELIEKPVEKHVRPVQLKQEELMPKPVMNPPAQQRKPLAPKQIEINTPIQNTPQIKLLSVNEQNYIILGVIGKGGSCKVFQCLDPSNKIVAIKCVNLDNTSDKVIEGYKNEIRLLERLQYCDQVITMYDSEFNENENKLYVVMEPGCEDLASFFSCQTKKKKRLSDNLIRYYWEVMLEAVQALHKEGIIHSDLKPANFLLVGGKLKLIDFGIAKALQQDKTSVILDTQIGTLNYMSPETIMDSCGGDGGKEKPKFKIGVKSDVWSLGCILYNMVYMKTPFQHIQRDLFKLQAITNPNFPIDFPDIPNKHLLDVMKKCLTRDPKLRPSVDELLSHPYLRDMTRIKMEEAEINLGRSDSGK